MQRESDIRRNNAHAMYRGRPADLLANISKCAQVSPMLGRVLNDLTPNDELNCTIQWGRGASCDHDRRVVTVTMGKCECLLTQELIQELTNMWFAAEATFLNSGASNGEISRENYVASVELMEFLGVRNVVNTFDALGDTNDLGCQHPIDKAGLARSFVQRTDDGTVLGVQLDHQVFQEYLNADFLQAHKERVGERYDSIAGNNGWSHEEQQRRLEQLNEEVRRQQEQSNNGDD